MHDYSDDPRKPIMASRGKGEDRRPIIILDGVTYSRVGPARPAEIARRVRAREMAFEIILCAGELIGAAMIIGSVVLLCIGLAP